MVESMKTIWKGWQSMSNYETVFCVWRERAAPFHCSSLPVYNVLVQKSCIDFRS